MHYSANNPAILGVNNSIANPMPTPLTSMATKVLRLHKRALQLIATTLLLLSYQRQAWYERYISYSYYAPNNIPASEEAPMDTGILEPDSRQTPASNKDGDGRS